MNLIEFIEKTYSMPLTKSKKYFLAEYEKARNEGKQPFITFPMHLGKGMMENAIKGREK